jgi:hypothetical protein
LAPPITTSGKYYVVSVGRKTGVFDSWCVFFYTSFPRFSFILNRPHVHNLTSGVSGNCHKSYATYVEAQTVYTQLKAIGLVRVVRNRGDEITFGPFGDAMQ